jgi:hypothetical protein
MRRLVLATLALAPLAVLAPHATAQESPPLPCDYWVHGCNVLAYVCDDNPNIDCGIH